MGYLYLIGMIVLFGFVIPGICIGLAMCECCCCTLSFGCNGCDDFIEDSIDAIVDGVSAESE